MASHKRARCGDLALLSDWGRVAFDPEAFFVWPAAILLRPVMSSVTRSLAAYISSSAYNSSTNELLSRRPRMAQHLMCVAIDMARAI